MEKKTTRINKPAVEFADTVKRWMATDEGELITSTNTYTVTEPQN